MTGVTAGQYIFRNTGISGEANRGIVNVYNRFLFRCTANYATSHTYNGSIREIGGGSDLNFLGLINPYPRNHEIMWLCQGRSTGTGTAGVTFTVALNNNTGGGSQGGVNQWLGPYDVTLPQQNMTPLVEGYNKLYLMETCGDTGVTIAQMLVRGFVWI
jgi:hypothetical protein